MKKVKGRYKGVKGFKYDPDTLSAEKIIGVVEKSSRYKYIIKVCDFKNSKYIDLRLHYQKEENGEFHPTRKGITIGLENIESIFDKLIKAASVLKRI